MVRPRPKRGDSGDRLGCWNAAAEMLSQVRVTPTWASREFRAQILDELHAFVDGSKRCPEEVCNRLWFSQNRPWPLVRQNLRGTADGMQVYGVASMMLMLLAKNLRQILGQTLLLERIEACQEAVEHDASAHHPTPSSPSSPPSLPPSAPEVSLLHFCPPVQVWKITVEITQALHHMKERKLMHRDVKPANVFIDETGSIKLGDLGLGKSFSSRTVHCPPPTLTCLTHPPVAICGSVPGAEREVPSGGAARRDFCGRDAVLHGARGDERVAILLPGRHLVSGMCRVRALQPHIAFL